VTDDDFRKKFFELLDFTDNTFHPLLWINGEPEIGEDNHIGGFSGLNAQGARLKIGNYCEISSFVDINVATSHRRTIGLTEENECRDIIIGDYVFIGSHCFIMGGTRIGDRSVIGAGTIVRGDDIPPYSLVVGNPAVIKPGYYKKEFEAQGILNSEDGASG
jgi:acetyltransferase-like isoleucine patch superfamily enzyme